MMTQRSYLSKDDVNRLLTMTLNAKHELKQDTVASGRAPSMNTLNEIENVVSMESKLKIMLFEFELG